MSADSSGSCSSNDSLPFTTNDASSCSCNNNGGSGGCAYCIQGPIGELPDAGMFVSYCGGIVLWAGGSAPACQNAP